MDAHDQRAQIVDQLGKWFCQRFTPSNQHIVMVGHKVTRTCCHSRPQTTFYAIALGRIAGFLGDGETDTGRRFLGVDDLQPKSRAPGAIAPGSPLKLASPDQPTQRVRHLLNGRHPATGPLGRELVAAVAAALVDDRTAVLGSHTGTETVTAGTHELGRLISTLHDIKPRRARFLWFGSAQAGISDTHGAAGVHGAGWWRL